MDTDMKKLILMMSVLLASTSSFAMIIADGMRGELSCRVAGSVDGGYGVVISYGGIAPHTEARLSEFFFNGKSTLIGNYVVNVSKTSPQDQVFADFNTQGQEFRLTVHGQPLVGAPVPAVLESNSKAGRFSANMVCSRMLQNY